MTTDSQKDSPAAELLGGMIAPALLVLLAVFNLVKGEVYWPIIKEAYTSRGEFRVAAGGLLAATSLPWAFWETVLMKLGFAGVLFSWHFLANHTRMERWTYPVGIAGAIVALAGMGIAVVGALW
ncbi:MAG TPA: hypothetical protein PKK06_03360 [Phycisphaerae bacterium]|nr:hypothetical protein [Phycisphaerae bacterium]HNU44724.1 hypothetical protein [Phycisphaerae bacterium]